MTRLQRIFRKAELRWNARESFFCLSGRGHLKKEILSILETKEFDDIVKIQEDKDYRSIDTNKFVYTKLTVACDWAGAVMPENHEKSEVISDWPTNIVNYRD